MDHDTSVLGFTLTVDEIALFWSRVDLPANRQDPQPCWLYRQDAPGDRGRYGHVRVRVAGGYRVFAHRLAFVLAGGALTDDCVIHSCDVPMCTSPHHLRAGDRRQNAEDRDRRNRRTPFLPRGADSPNAKLTDREVEAMRRARELGVPAKTLAVAFNVSLASVYARTDRGERRSSPRRRSTGPLGARQAA